MTEIKRCPWCGSAARLVHIDKPYVRCMGDDCGYGPVGATEAEAIAAWNQVADKRWRRYGDALDGQAALDEANNEIVRLRAKVAELSRSKTEQAMWDFMSALSAPVSELKEKIDFSCGRVLEFRESGLLLTVRALTAEDK